MAKPTISGEIVLEINGQRITLGEIGVADDDAGAPASQPDLGAALLEVMPMWLDGLGSEARLAANKHIGLINLRTLCMLVVRRMGLECE